MGAEIEYLRAGLAMLYDFRADPLVSVAEHIIGDGTTFRDYLNSQRKPRLQIDVYGNTEVVDLFSGRQVKDSRRLAILALGGGQAGVIGAGICTGMYDCGVFQRADGLIGVSVGLADEVYAETGQGKFGAPIYYERNTQGDNFVKLPKNLRGKLGFSAKAFSGISAGSILDTMFVGRCIRESYPLDLSALRSSSKEILASVSNAQDGHSEFLDVKDVEDPIRLIEAAICVPSISTVPWIEINGQPYFDGGFIDPVPLDAVFDRGYTDVLIVGNFDLREHRGFLANLQPLVMARLGSSESYGYSKEVVKAIGKYYENIRKAYLNVRKVIEEKDPQRQVAVISPLNQGVQRLRISNIDTDSRKLQIAFKDAYAFGRLYFLFSHTVREC